ncbi:helicase-associated domain-containing protein [uncultured Pseudokineococcus sp.]|uniref:helicase-associated domain-containing protein n=1 Tax=uncultured Pseudokineococcus sp. TaxID=1642928 RepID=UPI00262C29A8|nr:helicase-associated domain-containing protein [uncultured Pseudokineococcus sp.]
MPSLLDHLAALPADALAALLGHRPDAVVPVPPRDLAELAAHLDEPSSVGGALTRAPLPVLQVVEALLVAGDRPSEAALRRLLGLEPDDDALAPPLDWLAERVLVRRDGDHLVLSPGLREVIPYPLGLGPPLAVLLPELTVAQLTLLLRAHGRPAPGRKAESVAAVHALLSDGDAVRHLVDHLPEDMQRVVGRLLTGGSAAEDEETLEEIYGEDEGYGYRRVDEARRWAVHHGLALGEAWGYEAVVPAEVTLALRGAGWTAPLDTEPPVVTPVRADPAAVEREQAATATSSAALVLAVADLVRSDGIPLLRSGGVGARELARLTKRLGAPERDVRLALGLLDVAGLVEPVGEHLRAGGEMPAWRAAEPAVQHAAVLRAWWGAPEVLTRRTRGGRALPALAPVGEEVPGGVLRRALVGTLLRHPPGEGLTSQDAERLVGWYLPAVVDPTDGEGLPATWAEMTALGVVAHGSPTPLGLALLHGDDEALVRVAAAALPATEDAAVVGADLTAVVPGTPSGRVTALLDACADREGRGGAVVWRFTPGSIRRALDAGWSGEQLHRELADVAGALPQPLEYLLADVARRHGSLRVREAVCVVRGDDEALLAQAAADRSLRALGLVHVAPTVLTGTQDAATTLGALRAAGYLPVGEDASGADLVPPRPDDPGEAARSPAAAEERVRPTVADVAPEVGAPDVEALAAALLAGAPTGAPDDEREAVLRRLAPRLSPIAHRLLLHAVDTGEPVVLRYRSSTGRFTTRAVSEARLRGGVLVAWCHLRDDERAFALDRVLEVNAGV